ncbi:hypothetical protein AD998_15300 [bacterium 336/3]|nr:hypothetical protein AD998_15300 [bacterium 336/3]
MPLPIISTFGLKEAKHLLRRATFGANRATTQTTAGAGVGIVNNLTNFTMPPDPINEDGVNWTMTKPQPEEEDFKNEDNLKAWWLSRMYEDNTSLEKLTFFLHTVITTKRGVVGSSRFVYHQSKMFRRYLVNEFAGGGNANFQNYKDLIREMILENSMLIFLDGRINEKGLPNENFARELLELFTLGKGDTIGAGNYTNYTEQDIKEAARVLTGWTTDDFFSTNPAITAPNLSTATGLSTGKVKTNLLAGGVEFAYAHDNGTKTVLGRTITSPANPTPLSAYQEIVDLVDAIFAKRDAQGVLVACRYFVRRLYRFFVHHQIPASVENGVIRTLAQDMEANGFRIAPIIRNLLSSQHFYDMGALTNDGVSTDGAMVKSPMEVVLGTLKYFDVGTLLNGLPKPSGLSAGNAMNFYMKWGNIDRQMLLMGLDFLEPYDVAGYEPYHQAPNYARNWITTNTLANRYNFIRNLLNQSNGWGFSVDAFEWAKNNSGIPNINTVATQSVIIGGVRLAKDFTKLVADEFLPLAIENTELTDKRVNYFAFYHIRDIATVNPADPAQDARFNAWAFGWNSANPAIVESNARGPLRALLSAILQSPEYQLF